MAEHAEVGERILPVLDRGLSTLGHLLSARLWVHLDKLNVGERKHLLGEIRIVVLVVDDSHDPCLNDHLGAQAAGV